MKLFTGLTIVFLLFGLIIGVPTDIRETKAKIDAQATEDDDDLLAEPSDEYSQIAVIPSHGQQIYPPSPTADYEGSAQHPADLHSQAAQNFYPPFFKESPPLGHSRPYASEPGQSSGKFSSARPFDSTILGSGDFGVIRGGTFYADDEAPFHSDDSNEYGFGIYGDEANSNNGHGRPQAAPYVQKFTFPEEQFANFRDFADINTPNDAAFSQFVVVYANKNSTDYHPNPKNIFEQLELLDKEKNAEKKKTLSKSKAKLAKTKLEKKYKKKLGPKDFDYEPLLALS